MLRWAAFAAALCVAAPARAIPVFARRYKTACTTCHSLPPRLNPFGMAFRSNGYRLPGGEAHRNEDDVALGAPEWEGLWPKAILPGNVSDVPPIAGFLRLALERDTKHVTETDALAEVLSGGNLGKRASYYFSGGFTQRGTFIFRAILQVDQLAGPWLNVRAGQMEPGIVAFSRQWHRLTYTPYLAYEQGAHGIELGLPRPSIEVYGAGSDPGPLRGLRYVAGIAERASSAADVYGRVSYKFGGVAAAGDHAATGPPVAPLAETSLQVGAWTYRAAMPDSFGDTFATRTGADAQLLLGELEVDGAAWIGSEDGTPWSFLGGASLRPWPWLMLLARYEALFTPLDGATRRIVAGARGALQQNVALTLETEVDVPDGKVGGVAGLFVGF